jgi:hypothetical protein
LGKIDLGFDFVAVGAGRPGGPSGGMGQFTVRPKMGTNLIGIIPFKRTGVGLFFSHSRLDKYVENGFTFDFQFPGQIVNSNLTHPPSIPSGIRR